MDARTQELLDRLVAPGQFPNMSCSEGHELHEGVTNEIERLGEALKFIADNGGEIIELGDGTELDMSGGDDCAAFAKQFINPAKPTV